MLNYDSQIINQGDDFINPESFERENIVMLDALADELMIANIKEQINASLLFSSNPVNYLEKFDSRYNFLLNRHKDNPDLVRNIKDVKEKFYFEVNREIEKKFDIKVNFDSKVNSFIVKCLYEFFILGLTDNLITFLYNLIIKNKKSLSMEFEDNKKSIDHAALKKILKNKGDIVILTNIYSIVSTLAEPEYDYKDILRIIIEEDPNEKNNYMISQLMLKDDSYENLEIGNDFSARLLSPVRQREGDYNQIIIKLQAMLYENFIKKD